MSVYSDVLKLVRRQKLLDGVRTTVVGLSGGPDSVCLFDLLVLMAERGEVGTVVHAAHLNHELRGAESDEDERFACELAGRHGVPIAVERRAVAAARERTGGSVEQAARRERYGFLASVARQAGAEAVAVGHNADDQIETVLQHMIRGSGLKGLCGMSLVRPLEHGSSVRLIRPLLRTRRSEVLQHLRERGLSFREDSSNRDVTFTRNRIRNELLLLLESDYNPEFGHSVLRLSRSASDAYQLLFDVASAEAAECVGEGTIDIEKFRRVHRAVKPLVIGCAVAFVEADCPQFDAAHYDAVTQLALEGEPNSRVHLPGGISAVRSRGTLTFTKAGEQQPVQSTEAQLPVPGETATGGMTVKAELVDRPEFDLGAFLRAKTRYDEAMDFDALSEPLVVRPWRHGDRFQPLGAAGRKKVGDFLTNRKVPARERDAVLVLAAGGEPVWVVGQRIDERTKVTPKTRRVLKLSAGKAQD